MQARTATRAAPDVHERFTEALAARDLDAMARVLAPDALLRIAGAGPTSGDYLGRGVILRHVLDERQLSSGRLRTEVAMVEVDADHAVAVRRLHAGGRTVSETVSLQVTDGLISLIICRPNDPVAYDAFWFAFCRGR